jgi:asparagine synthase (glutamine-hydrolysing)
MRGGFVVCLSASPQPVERTAGRLRWHLGRPGTVARGELQAGLLVDSANGPWLESAGGITRIVHGATPAPAGDLEHGATRFAAIEWDGRRLRASRDPLGQVPMFYRALPGALWLATEVEPLVSLGETTPDLEALAARAAFAPIAERTGWTGIHRVVPGTAVVVDAAAPTTPTAVPFWEPEPRLGGYRGGREEARAELRERLAAAVGRCLDGPTGLLLSGGLDSGAVALMAPAGSRELLHMVHVRFPGLPGTHEEPFASQVARELGTRLHVVDGDASPWSPEADLDRLGIPYDGFPYGLDEPALAHLAHVGVGTALDGHDADGVLGMPGDEWGALLAQGAFGALLSAARSAGLRRAAAGLAGALVPRDLRPPPFRGRTYLEEVAAYLRDPLRSRVMRDDVERWRRPGGRWRELQLRPVLPRTAVSMEQKELDAARHGIDLRHPFADRALVDFLLSLPCSVKTEPGRPKALLRDALGDLLPGSLRERGKGDYREVLRRRVDPARCIEGIRSSGVRLPGIDYGRLFRDADRDPDALPLLFLVTLARAHAFARRAL